MDEDHEDQMEICDVVFPPFHFIGISAVGLYSTLTRLTAIINGINKIKSVQSVSDDGYNHASYCYIPLRFVLLCLMGLMALLKQSTATISSS